MSIDDSVKADALIVTLEDIFFKGYRAGLAAGYRDAEIHRIMVQKSRERGMPHKHPVMPAMFPDTYEQSLTQEGFRAIEDYRIQHKEDSCP